MKKMLFASATAAALLTALSVTPAAAQQAQTATVSPFHGNISPFYGNISPFYGNISPFHGNISPFYGNIQPFWGNISPFHGNIAPFWGNSAFPRKHFPVLGQYRSRSGATSRRLSAICKPIGRRLPQTGAAGQAALRDQLRELITRSERFLGIERSSRRRAVHSTMPLSAAYPRKIWHRPQSPETLANVSDGSRPLYVRLV
jgi:hypothetical protein